MSPPCRCSLISWAIVCFLVLSTLVIVTISWTQLPASAPPIADDVTAAAGHNAAAAVVQCVQAPLTPEEEERRWAAESKRHRMWLDKVVAELKLQLLQSPPPSNSNSAFPAAELKSQLNHAVASQHLTTSTTTLTSTTTPTTTGTTSTSPLPPPATTTTMIAATAAATAKPSTSVAPPAVATKKAPTTTQLPTAKMLHCGFNATSMALYEMIFASPTTTTANESNSLNRAGAEAAATTDSSSKPPPASSSPPRPYVACYNKNDIVCSRLLTLGWWERGIFDAVNYACSQWKRKTHKEPIFLDIGGNVGAMTVPMAVSGVETHAFEMMPSNVRLLEISRCVNDLGGPLPNTAAASAVAASGIHPNNASTTTASPPSARMTIYNIGLGEKPGQCEMISDNYNQGDGMMRCPDDDQLDGLSITTTTTTTTTAAPSEGKAPPPPKPTTKVVRGVIAIQTLDHVIEQHPALSAAIYKDDRPVIIKIDVEMSEIRVMKGAHRLLSHPTNKPKYIFSEVWKKMNATKYGELMLPYGYIAFAYSPRKWLTTVEDMRKYHHSLPDYGLDNIVWMLKEFAATFIHTPGQAIHIPPYVEK